ncbi:MAG: AAA family ATPase [Desulfuromonadales bacterium]|nr:AAA family ATPase [Desulfuromonadales bacterium]
MSKDLDPLIRKSLSAAILTLPPRRQQLFALLPPDTFRGPATYYRLGRFFATDTSTESMADIAKATGIDPVELVTLMVEDETFLPLQDHLVRLLTSCQTIALTNGLDVIQWATAITRISESTLPQKGERENEAGEVLFISATDILSQRVEVKPLLGKIIEHDCTGQIFGPSGDGKTFVTLDMALTVGTGGKWNGIQCDQGVVLYFAGEGHAGLRRRVQAWHQHHGKPDLSCCHITRRAIPFDDAGLTKAIREARLLVEQVGKPVSLIICDTLARHLQGDENSTRDMSEFVTSVDGLRAAFPDSTAIIVHHTGNDADKSGRSRGSSSLKAAMDFEIQCTKGLLTYTKCKDAEQPEPSEFKLVPVQIGTDEDGEPITSCVVQYGERSAKNREVGMTATERQLLELVNSYPDTLSGDLRTIFFDKRREGDPDAKPDTLKKAFTRSFDGLIEKKMIYQDGHIVKAGQRTKAGQSGTSPGNGRGDKRDTPLKGVPLSLPVSLPEILTFTESDFEGVIL